jgi:hypothetical protein
MTEKNNYSHGGSHVTSSHVPSRPSLFKTLEDVKEQVEFDSFAHEIKNNPGRYFIDPIYNELCLIIAEVYVKPPDSIMRIRGGEIEAAFVQEVYRALRHEHVEHVAGKFKEQTRLIHKKTSYLQTALYNVLFEYDASITNELRNAGLI